MCRPVFDVSGTPVLDLRTLYHPCVLDRMGAQFIPNDVSVGGSDAPILLLTGPNMGGKSTILRQVRLIFSPCCCAGKRVILCLLFMIRSNLIGLPDLHRCDYGTARVLRKRV